MAKRKTPQQVIESEMERLKGMGVTISVTSASSRPMPADHPMAIIADAAKTAGIYYENEASK